MKHTLYVVSTYQVDQGGLDIIPHFHVKHFIIPIIRFIIHTPPDVRLICNSILIGQATRQVILIGATILVTICCIDTTPILVTIGVFCIDNIAILVTIRVWRIHMIRWIEHRS